VVSSHVYHEGKKQRERLPLQFVMHGNCNLTWAKWHSGWINWWQLIWAKVVHAVAIP